MRTARRALRTRGVSRADVGVVAGLLALAGVLVPAALRAQEGPRQRAQRTRCANNLRMLGLAGIQYADDKRFFPHLGPIRELDGGYTTTATPKAIRALVWYGYHDSPEGFVCPETEDEPAPVSDAARANLRAWGWTGKRADVERAPWTGGEDPTLAETTELSYGWTRRGVNCNTRSTTPLAADRMRENHGEGGNVLQADATVNFTRAAGAYDGPLFATGAPATDGFLSVRGPSDPAPTRAPTGPAPAWAGTYSDGAVTLALRPRAGGFSGALTIDGAEYSVRGAVGPDGALRGTFEAGGDPYELSARLEGATLILTSGSRTYRLARR